MNTKAIEEEAEIVADLLDYIEEQRVLISELKETISDLKYDLKYCDDGEYYSRYENPHYRYNDYK